MTGEAWVKGMASLLGSGFAGWPIESAEAAHRSDTYREALNELSDAQFFYAIRQAQQSGGEYFPSTAQLWGWSQEMPREELKYISPEGPAQLMYRGGGDHRCPMMENEGFEHYLWRLAKFLGRKVGWDEPDFSGGLDPQKISHEREPGLEG